MKPAASPDTLLQCIYTSSTDFAIITMDVDLKTDSWNVGAEKIIGYKPDEIIGQPTDIIFTPEDRKTNAPRREAAQAKKEGRAMDYRWHMRKDGTKFWADGVMTPIYDSARHIGYLKIMRDITERRIAEEHIHTLANFDRLTSLINRASFDLHLKEMLANARRNNQYLVLHYLDLDKFKLVNDNLGHHAGDLLLKEVAQRLLDVVRDTDLVARIGGDEFVVIQQHIANPSDAGVLASKITQSMNQPFRIDNRDVTIGCSVGIAVFPVDADTPDELLKRADLALYRAKHEGNGEFVFYTKSLDEAVHIRNRNLSRLKLSEVTKAFRLVYQPKIHSKTGKPIALEALLRFSDPVLAAIPLEEVINLAIETGIMPGISFWVMEEACMTLKQLRESHHTAIKMCINVCGKELKLPGFPRIVLNILQKTGLTPLDIAIEVTERQIVDAEGKAAQTLSILKSEGVEICLDDFGTGYSALSYLTTLPIDTVKLDRAFINMIPYDNKACTMAKGLIGLLKALDKTVIAEGVETSEQQRFLAQQDCNAMQGYLYSAPLAVQDVEVWLSQHR